MNRTVSDVTCRVLHTAALNDAARAQTTMPPQSSCHPPWLTHHVRGAQRSPDAHPAEDDALSEMALSHRPTSSRAETHGLASLTSSPFAHGTQNIRVGDHVGPEHAPEWRASAAYLRSQRDALQQHEQRLRQRVGESGVCARDPLLRTMRVRATTTHAAALPYRRVQLASDGSRSWQLWLHMPATRTSRVTSPRLSASYGDIPAAADVAGAIPVAPPHDPLDAQWTAAAHRYERDYLRNEQKLQALRPDLWSRALPSYAALDGVPQLADNDRGQSFSRVRRVVQDDGITYVQ